MEEMITIPRSEYEPLKREFAKLRSTALSQLLDNASERTIRNVKVKTKASGQFRNNDGKRSDRYAKICSV